MNSPAVNQYERPTAQIGALSNTSLSPAAKAAMVIKSATVPSCFYPADAYKTCYPSPIRRSASPLARPPFFAENRVQENLSSRGPAKRVPLKAGTSTGDAKQCATNLQSPHYSRPLWPSQDALHLTLNAPAWAPLSAVSARPLSVVRSRQASLSAQPQAHSATTSISAKTDHAGMPALTMISNHRGLVGIGGFFVRALKTRREGT
jgi:hypothetical protein